jgi:hypothetical protein
MKEQLRTMVRSGYDLQKLRIQMGNRIVGNWKVRHGQLPGEKEDSLDKEAKEILAVLRDEYERITDSLLRFPTRKKFQSNEIISDYTQLCLVASYVETLSNENSQFKRLKWILQDYPIWTEWLEHVSGCGERMAGVIIGEVDIHKAEYPSSLWAYAGLDVVTKWQLQGTKVAVANLAKHPPLIALPKEINSIVEDGDKCTVAGADLVGYFTNMEDPPSVLPESEKATDTRTIAIIAMNIDGHKVEATYRMFAFGGRSRRQEHLVDVEYKNKKGEIATRKSLTFNPWLKTKLIGVLGPCFMRSPTSQYKGIYYDYRNRLENNPKHADKSDGHRHNMAIRYMIKRFLVDLYREWRTLEGLPVAPEYSEAKLGITHGKAA